MADVLAGIYCRISLAAMGDTTKTDDQARICRELAERLGWKIAAEVGHPEPNGVYTDHARSAWQKKRNRPAWNRMLEDVNAGKINAIVVYHGDRLVRRPEDLTDLLRLADSKGVKLASPTGTKDLDTERLELWIRAAFAEEESQRHSERRKAQYDRWRREGKVRPGGRGGRAYGFDTKGKVIEAEKQLIREAAQMILSGLSTGDVVRWLNSEGARTPLGAPFTYGTVRKMLVAPRMAGLMPDGKSKAAWAAVIDRADWEMVCAILDARAATFTYATNRAKHLLSGIATCGLCDGTMQIWQSKGRGGGRYQIGYRCSACKRLFRSQPLLDGFITGRVVQRLNNPANPAGRLPDRPGDAAELARLTEARASLAAKVEDPAEPHLELLLTRLGRVEARIAQLRESSADGAKAQLIARHVGISLDDFFALPLATKRALITAMFRIRILPASRRGPGFSSDDVEVTPL